MITEQRVLKCVEDHPEFFHERFYDYLNTNFHVFQAFTERANTLHDVGAKQTAALMIIYYLRYMSVIQERGSEFKISNNIAPDFSRLYVMLYPDRFNLFKFTNQKPGRAAFMEYIKATINDYEEMTIEERLSTFGL